MTTQIEEIKNLRSLLSERVNNLTTEQMNQIPQGFNNNIIWNMGHLIAVQQEICYKKAGLPLLINFNFWEKFRPGSKPEGVSTVDDIDNIKQLLIVTLDQLETDYNNKVFGNYIGWYSRIGTFVNNIDDALKFLLFHERLHSDIIIMIKKLVIN